MFTNTIPRISCYAMWLAMSWCIFCGPGSIGYSVFPVSVACSACWQRSTLSRSPCATRWGCDWDYKRPKGKCPDSKVHWADMGPIWGRQDPGGPHVGPMNFAILVIGIRIAHLSPNHNRAHNWWSKTLTFYENIDMNDMTWHPCSPNLVNMPCCARTWSELTQCCQHMRHWPSCDLLWHVYRKLLYGWVSPLRLVESCMVI